jgi:hypothetical protein
MSDALPDHVKQFLRENIASVEQLEILLHVFNKGTPVTADEVARALYISLDIARDRLQRFSGRGILIASSESNPTYRFNSTNSELNTVTSDLVKLYRERRVTLINFIYSSPSSTIQSFADAFIIGKKNT